MTYEIELSEAAKKFLQTVEKLEAKRIGKKN